MVSLLINRYKEGGMEFIFNENGDLSKGAPETNAKPGAVNNGTDETFVEQFKNEIAEVQERERELIDRIR